MTTTNGPFSDATYLNMLGTIPLLKHKNTYKSVLTKLWHLFKRSIKLLNLATFRLKNTGVEIRGFSNCLAKSDKQKRIFVI